MFKISSTMSPAFTPAQAHRVLNAIDIWVKVWNSDEFKSRVLNFSYEASSWFRTTVIPQFSQNDLSNAEVFADITGQGENAHAMYDINPDNNGSETAATDTESGITTIDIRWLDPDVADIYDLTNTLAHEFTHTPQGGSFTHSYFNRGYRDSSVPYGVGDITEELARKNYPGLV